VSGGIFLLRGDDELVEMRESPYEAEDVLQTLIAKFPSLLAGDQYSDDIPRRWLLVGREAALPDDQDAAGRWSVDHLFLDQDAVPTLVEVKRSSDTRIRREVVGQMLDYAANGVVYWPLEQLRELFARQCERDDDDPDLVISEVAGEETDIEDFWARVGENLRAGRVRMVFVSDEIPRELRRVVEFLNGQMNPAQVIAIEVKQYLGADGTKTLVPRVIGETAEVEARKGRRTTSRGERLDRETLLASIRQESELAADAAAALLDWASREARLGIRYTPTRCFIETGAGRLFRLAATRWPEKIQLHLQTLANHGEPWDDERVEQLVQELADIGVNLDSGERRAPMTPLEPLADDTRRQQFLTLMERVLVTLGTSA
jgi:hypothetical protein